MLTRTIALCLVTVTTSTLTAHDTWVETNTSVVRKGQPVHASLCLGNHENNARDFRLAGRVSLDWVEFEHITPSATRNSIKDIMRPTASAEKEGVWSGTLIAQQNGVHTLVQTLDRVMQHGKSVRGVRTAKTYFLVSDSLDNPQVDGSAHTTPIGLPIEMVFETCPFTEVAVNHPIEIQLLLHQKPLADCVVSCIPRGAELEPDFDARYESKTDSDGKVQFVPNEANKYLIVAHYTANDEKSDTYEFTSYATTLTLDVPNLTPYAAK